MQKQYLTEENYQRVNKKFKTISLSVFIVGLLIGLGLIILGIIKTNEAGQINAEREAAATTEVQAKVAAAEQRLGEVEASNLQSQIMDLESEAFQLEHANYTVYYDKEMPEQYIPLYAFGGFFILASAGIALAIWLITKRRALLAYHAQSVMPVAKEGIDEMTPTVANSAGNIAGSVAEGIARGIKNGKKD